MTKSRCDHDFEGPRSPIAQLDTVLRNLLSHPRPPRKKTACSEKTPPLHGPFEGECRLQRVLSGGGATAWSTCNTSVDPPPPRFTPWSTRTRHENNHGRVCYVIAMPRFIVILQSDSRDSAGRKLRFREVASSPLSCCRPLQSGGSIKRCCEATGAATRAAHMRSPESYHDSTPSCSGARTRVSA